MADESTCRTSQAGTGIEGSGAHPGGVAIAQPGRLSHAGRVGRVTESGSGWGVDKVEEQVLDDSMQHKANLCDVSDCR